MIIFKEHGVFPMMSLTLFKINKLEFLVGYSSFLLLGSISISYKQYMPNHLLALV